MLAVLGLLVLLSLAPGVGAQTDSAVRAPQLTSSFLTPDSVLRPPGGPRIVLLESSGTGVAALRLSIRLTEGPEEAGAGRMLAELALERMRGASAQVGAQVRAERTPWGLAFSATGAEIDLEYLGFVLRAAVEDPARNPGRIDRIRRALLVEISRRAESPESRLHAELRARVASGAPPLAGYRETVERFDAAALHRFWQRTHRAEAMSVVAVTSGPPEVVLAAIGPGIGAQSTDPLSEAPHAGPSPDVPPPPPIRSWYGAAYSDGRRSDPHAAVAALTVADQVRGRADGFEVGVRLLQLADRSVLVVSGSAQGRAAGGRRRVADMRAVVDEAVAATMTSLDSGTVARAVAALRSDLLRTVGTPWGFAEVVGRALDTTGNPRAAADHLAALERVTVRSLSAYLGSLRGPTTSDIRP